MAFRINNNLPAMTAGRHLGTNSADFGKRVERLSSGMRINRGADDAAGLSVSEGMRSEILGMRQGVANAEQGINLIQLAEGSLNEVSGMLRRMRELTVQSANSTINDTNREAVSSEFTQLTLEIDRIALSTSYNNQVLLTGFGNAVSQSSDISTSLDGFTGVTEIDISGAVPGTYTFTDSDDQDNQITLSVTQPDGTVISQSIDMGSGLDRESGENLVATSTTFLANFDRLGVEVTLAGPLFDRDSTTLKSTVADGGAGGTVVIDQQIIPIAANAPLATIAADLNTALATFTPPGSASLNTALNEIQIETAGQTLLGTEFLGLTAANAYIDGRLDGKVVVIEEGLEGGVLQVGPKNGASHRIGLSIGDMRATGPELNLTGLSVANQESSRQAISRIDTAILRVTRQRGQLGAIQNRLQFTVANQANAIENLTAAESAIRDADIAAEVAAFTRSQILTQAATAMAAQANQLPQVALSLLQ
jgi:flagellin